MTQRGVGVADKKSPGKRPVAFRLGHLRVGFEVVVRVALQAGQVVMLLKTQLLMFALLMIRWFRPGPGQPGLRWKPSGHWLCKAQ